MLSGALSSFTRKPGPQTVMEVAAQILLRRWVPKWHEVFDAPGSDLFFERVGHAFKPQLTGQRRLLAQLRQLAMYSHAVQQPENFMFTPDLAKRFAAILTHYQAGPGAWHFAVDDAGQVLDRTQDLYVHAFVIFACAHYGAASGDPRARDTALATAAHINTAFRRGVSAGFTEALDDHGQPLERQRRHESHMHLLEACLTAASVWNDPIFMQLADELVALFLTHLYRPDQNLLSEYYTNDLQPMPAADSGRVVCEAGHYYEWIWLLKKHAVKTGDPARHDATCLSLLAWANRYGWDPEYGGLYDETEVNGAIISDRKRIWPLTEGLKANALLLDIVPDRDAAKAHMTAMTDLLDSAYIIPRGFWTEWLNRDLTPVSDYMPATTPYHVYFGIMEARVALNWRGASRSWRAAPYLALYAGQRVLSTIARRVRKSFL